MDGRSSRPSTRRTQEQPPSARPASAPPARSAAPTTVTQAPRHRAAFLSDADRERLVGADTFTAGEPHPLLCLAAGHALHHEDLARLLALKPVHDISGFDVAQHARTFQTSGESFEVQLPLTLELDCGEKLVIRDTSELQRTVWKYDAASGCLCVRKSTQFVKAERCTTCNTRVTAYVQRVDGTRCSLVDAGYVSSEGGALSDVVLAMVMTARKPCADGDIRRSWVPEYFSPCRPSGSNAYTAVSEAAGGFPASHARAGARVVMGYECGFESPEGGVCGQRMAVWWSDGDKHALHVELAPGTHTHLAGLCADVTGERCAPTCRDWHRTPLQLHTGAPSTLLMAVLGTQASNALRGLDAGSDLRPAALSNAACWLAPPLAVLYRNNSFMGTSRQWEEALSARRHRILRRQGVPPVPSAPAGPDTARGRAVWQLAEIAKKKTDANKGHLGPVIMCDIGAEVAVALTTATRMRLLCALQRVANRRVSTGLQLDATGGIVREGGVEYLHVSLVYQLPAAAGGGRVIVATLITSSRAEAPMTWFLQRVQHSVDCEGFKFLPPHVTSDQDEATLNAVCKTFNQMSFEATLLEVVKRLNVLADQLFSLGLLGVALDADNPPPVALPIAGFQLHPTDGSAVPLLTEDLTLPLLCYGHFVKTAIDYIMYTSVYFQHFSRNDKGFYLVMHLNLLYPALSSPLFKGAESFFFLERYVEEVEQILSLPETLAVGDVHDGMLLKALVRTGKPEDARPGKSTPSFVFNVYIKGLDKPVITVRLSSPTDAKGGVDVEPALGFDAAMREVALSHLPGSPESYKDLSVEELEALPDFSAVPDEAANPPDAAGAGGAPAPAPDGGADAAAAAASAAADAGGGGPEPAAAAAAAPATMVRNPLHCCVVHNNKVAYPMVLAWLLRAHVMVFAGPTFRGDFEQLAFAGNTSTAVEKSHDDQKHLWHTAGQLPMPLVSNVASTIKAMEMEDAGILPKISKITEPVTARAVRNMTNGAKHQPAPKAAPAAGGGGKGGGAAGVKGAAGKGKGKAEHTPLSPAGIANIRRDAKLPAAGEAADQQWGTARQAAAVSAASRAVPSEVDAPQRAPTLAQLLAVSRSRAAPAAASLHVVTDEEVATVVQAVHRLPQVGDRAAASKVAAVDTAADTLLKARRHLLESFEAFQVKAQVATDAAVAAAKASGYVAPGNAAGAGLVALGRGKPPQRR